MEKFIKEHEKEFLDYIEFERDTIERLKYLNKRRGATEYEANRIINSEDRKIDFDLEIKKIGNRINELNSEIININIEQTHLGMNKLIGNDLENKDIRDFNLDIEILKKEKEKKKLEEEIEKLKIQNGELGQKEEKVREDNIKLEEHKESISFYKQSIEELEQKLEERKSELSAIIEDRIQLKERVLEEISKRKEDEEKKLREEELKLKEEIRKKEEAISKIHKAVFEDELSKQIQKETIERLEKELKELKEKKEKKETLSDFEERYNLNLEECNELKKLKSRLYSGDIRELLKQTLNIKEEKLEYLYTDPFPDINNEQQVVEQESNNQEIEQEEEKPKQWNGKWGLVEIKERKGIIDIVKEKISNTWNKVKNRFNNKALKLVKEDGNIEPNYKKIEIVNETCQLNEKNKDSDNFKGNLKANLEKIEEPKNDKKSNEEMIELKRRLGLIPENYSQETSIKNITENVKKQQNIEEDIEL